MATDFQGVGDQFVQHYFNTFDSNRNELAGLYTEGSMMTYEGEQFMGVQGIMEKLSGLPGIQHKVVTSDYQPTMNNGIIAFVVGTLSIEGGPPMNFTQVFPLAVGGNNGYYVHNDIFRLSIS